MSENAREIRRPDAVGRKDRHAAGVRVTPRLGVLDLLLYLWRSRLLMFLIFFAFVLAGLATTQLFPAKALATAKVLISTAPEVSMVAAPDRSARISIRPSGALLDVERQLAMSPQLAAEAISSVGADRLYPDPFELAARPSAESLTDTQTRFLADLDVHLQPGSSVLELRFAHPNGKVAVEALEAFTSAYLNRRNAPEPEMRRLPSQAPELPVEARLAAVNDAILAFLDEHAVADLTAAIASADAALSAVASAQIEVQASLGEARGRARELAGELEGIPAEIDLFVETVSTDRVGALMSEREQMLARFGADHPLIGELDARLADARKAPGVSLESGRRRTGPNPVFQRLAGERANARAQVAALQQKASALASQRTQAEAHRRELAALEPEWRALVRMRDALEAEASTQAHGTDVQEYTPNEEPVTQAVSLFEPARLVGQGVSPAHGVLAIFAGLGLVCALALGLIRGWLSQGMATSSATERTLGVRVLATVGDQ